MLRISSLLILSILVVPTCRAELKNCGGTWTDRDCSSLKGGGAFSQVTSGESPELSKKRSLFHDLNMKNIQARREWGIVLDLDTTRMYCDDPGTSVSQCEERIAEMQSRLDRRVRDVQSVRASERAVQLQEEANRIQQERNEIEYQRALAERYQRRNPEVIIINRPPRIHVDNDVNVIQIPSPRHPRRHPDYEYESGSIWKPRKRGGVSNESTANHLLIPRERPQQ